MKYGGIIVLATPTSGTESKPSSSAFGSQVIAHGDRMPVLLCAFLQCTQSLEDGSKWSVDDTAGSCENLN